MKEARTLPLSPKPRSTVEGSKHARWWWQAYNLSTQKAGASGSLEFKVSLIYEQVPGESVLDKDAYGQSQSQAFEFDPWNSHERRELTPTNCLLISTHSHKVNR